MRFQGREKEERSNEGGRKEGRKGKYREGRSMEKQLGREGGGEGEYKGEGKRMRG